MPLKGLNINHPGLKHLLDWDLLVPLDSHLNSFPPVQTPSQYVIKNGQVMVYLDFGANVQQLAQLASGQFFGEGALLKGKSARRGANVSALAYSLIYSLHVDEMNKMLVRYPKVMETIEKIAAEREAATASMSVRTFGVTEHSSAIEAAHSQAIALSKTLGSPAAIAFREWLVSLGLDAYTDSFKARGYDSLLSIEAMSAEDMEAQIKAVTMLPGHAAVFRQAADRLKHAADRLSSVSANSSLNA